MAKDFAFLKRDDNRVPIQTGTHIQTFDATATPQNSPLAFDATTFTTIAIPSNAAEVVFAPSVALRVSEVAGGATYFVQPIQTQAYGVAGMDTIYIRGNAAIGTLNFYFVLVKE
jgi:hypothetical protein